MGNAFDCRFLDVGGLAGQHAQLTGGPRCDIDAASRRAERSGWSAPTVTTIGLLGIGGTTARLATSMARDTVRQSRSPAAISSAPAATASACAASMAGASDIEAP
jgi:hypothetical protein